MQAGLRLISSAAFLATLAACGDDPAGEATVAEELCEHMKEGPGNALTATVTATAAPSATLEHARADITLVDVAGGKGGRVSYEAGEVIDYVIALDRVVPLAIAGPGGAAVAIEASETAGAPCAEVAVRHTVPMGIGKHTLSFGPTAETSVRMVVEEAGAHAHE